MLCENNFYCWHFLTVSLSSSLLHFQENILLFLKLLNIFKALDGDVLYAEFYNRIINQPQESVYQTVTDGMNLLKTESAVLQISEGSLKVKFIHQTELYPERVLVERGTFAKMWCRWTIKLNSFGFLVSSLASKWPIPVPFCKMDHQKSNF